MTKQEFLAMAKAMYRVGNMGDSDNPARPDWVNPSTVSGVCANLDRMFRDLEEGGILTGDERAARLDATDSEWPIVFRAVSRMFDEAKAAQYRAEMAMFLGGDKPAEAGQ